MSKVDRGYIFGWFVAILAIIGGASIVSQVHEVATAGRAPRPVEQRSYEQFDLESTAQAVMPMPRYFGGRPVYVLVDCEPSGFTSRGAKHWEFRETSARYFDIMDVAWTNSSPPNDGSLFVLGSDGKLMPLPSRPRSEATHAPSRTD
jgi:hypothetical protein